MSTFRQRARATAYDLAVTPMTTPWYREWLQQLHDDSFVLAVGVGTGLALLENRSVILAKNIRFVVLEHDHDYFIQCSNNVSQCQCESRISVFHNDILLFNSRLPRLFDAVHINCAVAGINGQSPVRVDVLKKATNLLNDREDGRVWLSASLRLEKSAWSEFFMSNFLHFSTVDFGNALYPFDVEETIYAAHMVPVNTTIIPSSQHQSSNPPKQEHRLIEIRSRLYVPDENDTIN